MRILRWLAIVVAVLVAIPVVLSVVARFSDGPIAVFAGGPLEAGPLVEGPEPDWSQVADVDTVELQLESPPRSRTTWIVEYEGKIYIPCGYLDSTVGRLWKKWPYEAVRDGRALVRIDGKRYRRTLVRILEPELFAAVAAKVAEKYDVPLGDGASPDEGGLWIFELAPRGAKG